MKTLIKNGTVVTASETIKSDILIKDGVILQLGTELSEEGIDEIIDASGLLVMPGGIDTHTHLDMPFGGTVTADDFFTGQRAAAFGGTTCHIDFALQSKGKSLADGVREWKKKAEGKAVIDYSFHIAVTDPTPETIASIPELKDEGVTSLKVFTAYKNVFQVDDTAFLQVLKKAGEHGMLTMVHAENGDAISLKTEELLSSGCTDMKYHSVAHDEAVEAEASSRVAAFCGMTGSPLYIVHISCEGALDAVRKGRAAGYPLMGETCTQYMFITEDDIASGGFEGAKYICSPPPKKKKDQKAVWAALQDGTVQTIGTDHCSFWFEGGKDGRNPGKELGKESWAKVPNGVPGIEDRFPVMWHNGVNGGKFSANKFVELVATNPAKIFGLYPQKGTIAPGADADIVLFDPDKEHTISAETHHMNVDYNCYEGMTVKGWPQKVFIRGHLVVDGEKWLGQAGFGRYLSRKADNPVL